jgi:hypothetical protein
MGLDQNPESMRLRELLKRQAKGEAARNQLSWPEKIRLAGAIRPSVVAGARTHQGNQDRSGLFVRPLSAAKSQ